MALEVTEYLEKIRAAAVGLWRRRPILRRLVGGWEDVAQEATAYCLKYGDRYYDEQTTPEHYFEQLARRGVWDAARKDLRRIAGGKCQVYYGQDGEDAKGNTKDDAELVCYNTDLYQALNRLDIATTFRVISEREKAVLGWYYGLNGEPIGATEIGTRLGISHSRVVQIIRGAIERIQRNFKVDCCG